jgi:hypothetical protein
VTQGFSARFDIRAAGWGGERRDSVCRTRDPYVRELETYFLAEAGFGVTFADDGLQALCRRLKSDPETSDIAVLIFRTGAERWIWSSADLGQSTW